MGIQVADQIAQRSPLFSQGLNGGEGGQRNQHAVFLGRGEIAEDRQGRCAGGCPTVEPESLRGDDADVR